MKMRMLAVAAAAGGIWFGLAAPSDAATTACAGSLQLNGILANVGCEVGSTENDRPANVNPDNIFGHSDWTFLESVNGDGTPDDVPAGTEIGLTLTGNSKGGTWTIDNVWSMYDDIMLVLKDGRGTTYIGYLLDLFDISGSYASPFPGPNNNVKDISHISAYGRGDGSGHDNTPGPVPLPGAVYLFGTALAGLGLLGRRRRAA